MVTADKRVSGFFVGHTLQPVGPWAIRRGRSELTTPWRPGRDVGERGETSTPSCFNLRVKPMELHAGIIGGELPVDSFGSMVPI